MKPIKLLTLLLTLITLPALADAFICAYEKDHNPPLTTEAEKYYQKARNLEKTLGFPDWKAIEENYQKAADLNHWKAMNNLATLYQKGGYARNDEMDKPTGIKPDAGKALALYIKMVDLKVPMGYYNWYLAIQRGLVQRPAPNDARIALNEAARLGSPLAQVRLGNYFAYSLPQEEQRNDLAEQYFRCAGAQDNIEALIEVAQFYKITKKNMPLALYYFQKAASLGSEDGFMYLADAFLEEPTPLYDFGYAPNPELAQKYEEMYQALRKNSELKFPNLIKDYPLPRHPTQGYDADHPDKRPE